MAEAGAPRMVAAALLASVTLAMVWVSSARAFDPVVEAKNFSKIEERQTIYDTPQYQLAAAHGLDAERARGARRAGRRPRARVRDPTSAGTGDDGCAGDVRLYDWESNGYGIVQPVLFTARNGATLSGHVWATRAGPAHAARAS